MDEKTPEFPTVMVDALNERRARRAVADQGMEVVKARYVAGRSSTERVADALTRAAGSTPFLVLHVVWFAGWILWNVGALGAEPFDPFPFGLLTMVVSLEAIFLSIFVLVTQSRESAIAELREEFTLAVDLSTEAETTKILQLLVGLYARLGYPVGEDPELARMILPLDKEALERNLSDQIQHAAGKATPPRQGPSADHKLR
ncbi:MAG TPA: DUF1003 domain-containing protein [Longimicrobiaceae bacterium]